MKTQKYIAIFLDSFSTSIIKKVKKVKGVTLFVPLSGLDFSQMLEIYKRRAID